MGKTNIEITEETRRRLRVWKAERDLTYDEALNELLDLHDVVNAEFDRDAIKTVIEPSPEPPEEWEG